MRPDRFKRVRPGDIGRVEVSPGAWARLQYLGQHEQVGDAVLVDANLEDCSGNPISGKSLKSYITFYLFRDFVKDGLVKIIGHEPPPLPVPEITRSPQRIGGGPSKSWFITDLAGNRTFRETLTEDELEIPRLMIVSHDMLVDRLSRGWQPSHDVEDESSSGDHKSSY